MSGLGFRAKGLFFRALGLRFRALGLGLRYTVGPYVGCSSTGGPNIEPDMRTAWLRRTWEFLTSTFIEL